MRRHVYPEIPQEGSMKLLIVVQYAGIEQVSTYSSTGTLLFLDCSVESLIVQEGFDCIKKGVT